MGLIERSTVEELLVTGSERAAYEAAGWIVSKVLNTPKRRGRGAGRPRKFYLMFRARAMEAAA